VLLSEGCILMGAEIERSVVGIRSRIGSGTRIRDSLVLGADDYESLEDIDRAQAKGLPRSGSAATPSRAGDHRQERAGGRGVRILNEAGVREADGDGYYVATGS